MIERLRRIGKVKTTFIVAFIAFVFAYYYFIKRKEKLHSRKVEIQGALRQEQIQPIKRKKKSKKKKAKKKKTSKHSSGEINKESSSAKLATEDVPSGEQVVLKNELVSSEIEKPGMAAVTPSIGDEERGKQDEPEKDVKTAVLSTTPISSKSVSYNNDEKKKSKKKISNKKDTKERKSKSQGSKKEVKMI
ncbi:Abnormal spindle-like microcephaly-associated protein [Dirofilaria immitis]